MAFEHGFLFPSIIYSVLEPIYFSIAIEVATTNMLPQFTAAFSVIHTIEVFIGCPAYCNK